jgi:hypothetical protein
VGRGIAAIVRIRTTHAQIKHCLSAFEVRPEIIKAHRITGEDCFMVRIVVEDMTQLEEAIDTLAKFRPVTTAVVLTPLGNDKPLLPAFGDADSLSQLRFSRDGNLLLFARHQFNGVMVYGWDLSAQRQDQIKRFEQADLLLDACRVANNIDYSALQDNDLKRLPVTLRAQPCISQ